ncbi:MAG: hypothetical protein JWM68_1560 [Verrucomicrobiales bacterium]|nr:hypothetical protein [Verrucomicrobiales bacterium]
MKGIGLFLTALLFGLTGHASEMRGIWVDAFGPGFKNKRQVTELVRDCRKYNFNAVFVQMRKRGDAYYVPHSPNEDTRALDVTDFDALQEIIQQCHQGEQRIQVHCWAVAYFVWSWSKPPLQTNHVFNIHKDLLTKNSSGETVIGKGYFLDPGNPDVSAYLLNVAKDVVMHYDVDGFHWDYLRYPEQDSGYNKVAIKRYQEEFQVEDIPRPGDARFCEWRRRQVTDFVRWSTAELLSSKSNLVISASVFANYQDARDYRFQDWVEWDRQGIMDACVPMNFAPNQRFLFNPRADFALTNQGANAVWMGQGAYMNAKENTVKQLEYCRFKGFPGTVLYSYRNPSEDSFKVEQSADEQRDSETTVTIDNKQAEAIGTWHTGQYGKFYREDYVFKERGVGSNYVSFRTQLLIPGEYDVSEWHVSGTNRTKVGFTILHANGAKKLKIDQRSNGAKWNTVGRFWFGTNAPAEVRITDMFASSNCVVVADAIRFSLAADSDKNAKADPPNDRSDAQRTAAFEYIRESLQSKWESAPTQSRAGGIVKGTVSVDGKPVYNAKVTISGAVKSHQRTESNGYFAFFGLPEGNFDIEVTTPNGRTTTKPLDLARGQLLHVTFTQ